MIKENDLRIGNCVYQLEYKLYQYADTPVPVPTRVKLGFTSTENFYPVKLTDEILTQVGYPLQTLYTYIGEVKEYQFGNLFKGSLREDGKLEMGYNAFHYGSFANVRLDYLHQLQNFYYVHTGEELELKW